MYEKSKWDSASRGEMTEEAIRVAHGAPSRARVSKYKYIASEKIEGSGIRGVGYVLDGRLTMVSSDGEATFERGDVFRFSGGNYKLLIDSNSAATVVWAWEFADFPQDRLANKAKA